MPGHGEPEFRRRLVRLTHPPPRQHPIIMNWSDFFAMGGYALYVWTAYGLMAIVLAVNLVLPFRRRAEVVRKIQRLWAQAEKKA